ncbi:hypothetical protein OJJOAM_003190 [Cupriavidus sp. H18C1]
MRPPPLCHHHAARLLGTQQCACHVHLQRLLPVVQWKFKEWIHLGDPGAIHEDVAPAVLAVHLSECLGHGLGRRYVDRDSARLYACTPEVGHRGRGGLRIEVAHDDAHALGPKVAGNGRSNARGTPGDGSHACSRRGVAGIVHLRSPCSMRVIRCRSGRARSNRHHPSARPLGRPPARRARFRGRSGDTVARRGASLAATTRASGASTFVTWLEVSPPDRTRRLRGSRGEDVAHQRAQSLPQQPTALVLGLLARVSPRLHGVHHGGDARIVVATRCVHHDAATSEQQLSNLTRHGVDNVRCALARQGHRVKTHFGEPGLDGRIDLLGTEPGGAARDRKHLFHRREAGVIGGVCSPTCLSRASAA